MGSCCLLVALALFSSVSSLSVNGKPSIGFFKRSVEYELSEDFEPINKEVREILVLDMGAQKPPQSVAPNLEDIFVLRKKRSIDDEAPMQNEFDKRDVDIAALQKKIAENGGPPAIPSGPSPYPGGGYPPPGYPTGGIPPQGALQASLSGLSGGLSATVNDGLGGTLGGTAGGLGDTLSGTVQGLGSTVMGVGTTLTGLTGGLLGGLGSTVEGLSTGDAVGAATGLAQGLGTVGLGAAQGLGGGLMDVGMGLGSGLASTGLGLGSGLASTGMGLASALGSTLNPVGAALKAGSEAGSVVGSLGSTISGLLGSSFGKRKKRDVGQLGQVDQTETGLEHVQEQVKRTPQDPPEGTPEGQPEAPQASGSMIPGMPDPMSAISGVLGSLFGKRRKRSPQGLLISSDGNAQEEIRASRSPQDIKVEDGDTTVEIKNPTEVQVPGPFNNLPLGGLLGGLGSLLGKRKRRALSTKRSPEEEKKAEVTSETTTEKAAEETTTEKPPAEEEKKAETPAAVPGPGPAAQGPQYTYAPVHLAHGAHNAAASGGKNLLKGVGNLLGGVVGSLGRRKRSPSPEAVITTTEAPKTTTIDPKKQVRPKTKGDAVGNLLGGLTGVLGRRRRSIDNDEEAEEEDPASVANDDTKRGRRGFFGKMGSGFGGFMGGGSAPKEGEEEKGKSSGGFMGSGLIGGLGASFSAGTGVLGSLTTGNGLQTAIGGATGGVGGVLSGLTGGKLGKQEDDGSFSSMMTDTVSSAVADQVLGADDGTGPTLLGTVTGSLGKSLESNVPGGATLGWGLGMLGQGGDMALGALGKSPIIGSTAKEGLKGVVKGVISKGGIPGMSR